MNANEMTNEALLYSYLDARDTVRAPGYGDFPDERLEQTVKAARAEILRRMEQDS